MVQHENESETKKRVLVVEDSDSMRALVRDALEGAALAVRGVATGFAALKELKAGRYDLIITDINMPDLTGLEIIQFVRSGGDYTDTPLVVISTDGQTRDRKRALDLGADDYLVKPFAMDELVACCLAHLASKNRNNDRKKDC